jgi:hypothetical protein
MLSALDHLPRQVIDTHLEYCLSDSNASVIDQNSRFSVSRLDFSAQVHDSIRVGDISLIEMHIRHYEARQHSYNIANLDR